MKTNRVEDSLTSHQLAELHAALRVKGDSRHPSYADIGKPFDLHPEQVRRVHLRLNKEQDLAPDGMPANLDDLSMRDALIEMRKQLASGASPAGLFAHISRDELAAMMAGLVRMLYMSGKQPATLLKTMREYGLMEGYYEQANEKEPGKRREIDMSDLARMEQETQEHLEAIRNARKRKTEARFLQKYGTEILEVEAEEIGSVGEEQGG